jgi:hypothetical protein
LGHLAAPPEMASATLDKRGSRADLGRQGTRHLLEDLPLSGRYMLPAIGLAIWALASAPAPAATPSSACFHARDWQAWKSPAPNEILLRVGANDIYRLDLREGSNQLQYSDMHLVNRHETSSWLCQPADFDLLLSDDHGIFSEPLFVSRITKLTPDQIAAIPAKYRP